MHIQFHGVPQAPDRPVPLLGRMFALDLDPDAVVRGEPELFRDLEIACTVCASHDACRRDMQRPSDADGGTWEAYCPNALLLRALSECWWFHELR